jgi:hypothetical protein
MHRRHVVAAQVDYSRGVMVIRPFAPPDYAAAHARWLWKALGGRRRGDLTVLSIPLVGSAGGC